MLSTLSETKQMTYKELLNQLQSLTEECKEYYPELLEA